MSPRTWAPSSGHLRRIVMENARSDDHEPAARTVGIRELSEHAEEIVREVRATGRPVDITVDGETVARLFSSAEQSDAADRRRAARAWLEETEAFAQEVARRWPSSASSVDLVGHAAFSWGKAWEAGEPPRRRWRARCRRSKRLPCQTKGVGLAFQPATVSSSQAIRSSWDWGCCPSRARRTMMRWTDSAMFNQEPLSGV